MVQGSAIDLSCWLRNRYGFAPGDHVQIRDLELEGVVLGIAYYGGPVRVEVTFVSNGLGQTSWFCVEHLQARRKHGRQA
jgi:hypothetical protein